MDYPLFKATERKRAYFHKYPRRRAEEEYFRYTNMIVIKPEGFIYM